MSFNPPLMFGPIAPENNPPINPQFYKPSLFNISSITNGLTSLVTTTTDHNYVVGQIVRLLVSQIYNATQFNEKEAYVLFIPNPNQVILGLDSTSFNLFIPNLTSNTTQPQIVAVGDANSGQINANGRKVNGTFIPGSFQDISPV